MKPHTLNRNKVCGIKSFSSKNGMKFKAIHFSGSVPNETKKNSVIFQIVNEHCEKRIVSVAQNVRKMKM